MTWRSMECPAPDCRRLFVDPGLLKEHYAVAHMEYPNP